MPCCWRGNRRFGVALAMRHRLQWFIHLGAHGLRNGDEHPAYTSPHGAWQSWHSFYRQKCIQTERQTHKHGHRTTSHPGGGRCKYGKDIRTGVYSSRKTRNPFGWLRRVHGRNKSVRYIHVDISNKQRLAVSTFMNRLQEMSYVPGNDDAPRWHVYRREHNCSLSVVLTKPSRLRLIRLACHRRR